MKLSVKDLKALIPVLKEDAVIEMSFSEGTVFTPPNWRDFKIQAEPIHTTVTSAKPLNYNNKDYVSPTLCREVNSVEVANALSKEVIEAAKHLVEKGAEIDKKGFPNGLFTSGTKMNSILNKRYPGQFAKINDIFTEVLYGGNNESLWKLKSRARRK